MITPVQIFRALEIFGVLIPHTLNRELIGTRSRSLRYLSYLNPFSFRKDNEKRGPEIRKALEKLGPIYVKFGQLLSTRSDLIPADVIVELEKLQDRVTPFPNDIAIQLIENAFNQPTSELFASFEDNPLASASVAQVHAATLKTGEEVVVKIIRPTIEKTIKHDIAVLKLVANLVERFWKHGKRLRPLALVSEFEKTIFDELDLMREAANASQLKRNFDDSEIMYVPQVYWSYTCENIMTMERIYGVQISDHEAFEKTGTNLKKLAEHGVEIFFTQVFRDAFFHADMHPGNLFVDITDPDNPKYLGVDFGIMGTLSPMDQLYLADNILAFLTRDYRRIAELHIESGWVAANTRVDEFESAIRTVAEPIFQKPLAEISFGQLLLKLFQTAERFHMVVQPQLFLLQKTLFYIESLGRKLYPNLDLWETAKPFMTKWMRQQRGLRTLAQSAFKDWRMNTENLLKMPNLAFDVLQEIHTRQKQNLPVESKQPKKSNNKRLFLLGAGVALLGSALLLFTHFISHQSPIDLLGVGVGFISLAWLLPN